jgi:hypothetical protein
MHIVSAEESIGTYIHNNPSPQPSEQRIEGTQHTSSDNKL